MPHRRTLTPAFAALCLAIVAAAGVAGWAGYQSRMRELRDDLLADMRRLAAAFDVSDIHIPTDAANARASARAALVTRLERLRRGYPDARYVGVFRRDDADGRAVEVAAVSSSAAAIDTSRWSGQAARLGEPVAESPREDDSGWWVAAHVPLALADAEPAVLVLDLEAAHWPAAARRAAVQAAFYACVLGGLPLLAAIAVRRQGRQRDVIRNLSEAVEQSHSEIMIVSPDGNVGYANRGLCGQLGYTRDELLGRDWRPLGLAPAADDLYDELLRVVGAGRAWEGEWSNRRKDGSTYPVHGVVTPVKNPDDSVGCWIVVLEDVTEAKRREAELRDARDRAEAGDRAKGHFLATMSHEVRTPLNGIVGFTSLLLETPLSTEQRDYVQTIRLSTEALIQLTGDILDFARIESGKLKLDPLPCDPRECVEDAFDLMAAKAAEKQIELLHYTAPDVPAAVLTDGGRLRQVLVNLVGNAVKFTDKGEVTVGLRLLPPDHPEAAAAIAARGARHGVLEFIVRDTGIGIAPDQFAKLFKPFSQVDDSSTRRYTGTGLGLAICRNLVQLMGGEIGVSSEPGRGSEFRFTISTAIAAPQPPQRDLGGLTVALVARPSALRRELACLLTGWNAKVTEMDAAGDGDGANCRAAIIDLDEGLARTLADTTVAVAGGTPQRAVALVPLLLSSELRSVVRDRLGALLNKPVRHEALFEFLAGARSRSPFPAVPPVHFGFRVLLVEDNPMEQRILQRVLANLGCSWRAVASNAAVAELLDRSGEYDLVIVDLQSSEPAPRGVLAQMRSGSAGARAQTMWVIAVTGDTGRGQRGAGQPRGANEYLKTPVAVMDLQGAFKRFRHARVNRRR